MITDPRLYSTVIVKVEMQSILRLHGVEDNANLVRYCLTRPAVSILENG